MKFKRSASKVAQRVAASCAMAVLLLVAPIACHSSHTTPSQPQPDIRFELDDFTLIERSGKKISKGDLRGKVWIASFVFTRCTGPCPAVTSTVARLQAELKDEPDVRLVTFTVDPGRDDPAELRRYADSRQADPERWLFLTGDEKEIHRLLQESFKVTAKRNDNAKPGDEFDHAVKLAVVDKHGIVRAYFQGMFEPSQTAARDAEIGKIKDKVRELLKEK